MIPTIANTTEGLWDPDTVSKVIESGPLRGKHVQSIVDLVNRNNYDGIQIDYEDLPAGDRAAFSSFVTDLSAALHAANKLLYVTVHVKEDDAGYDDRNKAQDYAAIGKAADLVCLMAYDWHWSTGPAGPIAPYNWVERVIRYSVTQIPADKIVLGVGLFGYDWVGTQATNLTWRQVVALAAQYQVDELWDVGGQSPHFSYVDGDGNQHEVWYENGRSATTKFDLARRYELGGIERGAWAARIRPSGSQDRDRGLPSEPSAQSPAPRPGGRACEATRKGGGVSEACRANHRHSRRRRVRVAERARRPGKAAG